MENTRVRCLIIDDEPLAIKLVRTHLSKFESFEVAGECRNALKAVDYLREGNIDLMFLDINMPEITGIEFLRSLPNPPAVIITTAFREYALEGYDLDIIDFLLKPISFERFMKAINRYIERSRNTGRQGANQKKGNGEKLHIHIQDGKNIFKLLVDDILYLEGYGEYVKFITAGRNHLVRGSLTDFESRLTEKGFLRIHKSYIANTSKITGFSSVHVMLGSVQLPVGRIYRDRVVSILRSEGR